jgi:hypothetical protein
LHGVDLIGRLLVRFSPIKLPPPMATIPAAFPSQTPLASQVSLANHVFLGLAKAFFLMFLSPLLFRQMSMLLI